VKKKNINATASKVTVLGQVCKLIPTHCLSGIVSRHQSEHHARDFSHWSQVVSLLYSKIVHCFGLNDLCVQPIRLSVQPVKDRWW